MAQNRKINKTDKNKIGLFSFGAIAGPVLSQIDGDGYQGFDKLGYNVGLKGDARLSDRFGLEVNVAFSKIGATFPSEMPQSITMSRIIDMSFAEVPFVINYLAINKGYDLYLEFGGGLYQLLDYKVTEDEKSFSTKPFGTIEEDLRRRGFNLLGGFEIKRNNISFGARVTSSLTYQYYNKRYFELSSQGKNDPSLVPLLRTYYAGVYVAYTLLSVAR